MDREKKKRAANWSSEEKEILRQLISISRETIENKSTKTSSNQLKAKEWKNITSKFNEISGNSRIDGELKLAWKRMKMTAKTNLSAHKRAQAQTGGGAKPPSPSPEDLEIMEIAPYDFVEEVNNYDSDAEITVASPHYLTDPVPGTSQFDNKNIPEPDIQEISDKGNILENVKLPNENPKNKSKTSQNSSEEMRQKIVQSNTDFKKRQLELMEVEHEYFKKISQLKIEKLNLEIALLKSKLNETST